MPSTLRFRLYPSNRQEAKMLTAIGSCRHLWNEALAQRKERWQKGRKSTSYNHQQWMLTQERRANSELAALHSQVAQDVLRRLDKAFQRFFKHQAGHPRFKRFTTSGSLTYPQCYNGSVRPDVLRGRLYLSKIGNVKVVFHRMLPKEALLKTCTVIREPCGEWYASLVYEDIMPLQNVIARHITSPLGVDLGLKSLIVTSDGVEVPHPRFLRKAEKRLKHLQKTLSRKKKDSKNRVKARRRVASCHAKVARQRADLNHKLSANLVKEHDLIGFEALQIKNMVKSHNLSKSIHDAAWGQLVRFTEYKAALKGTRLVKVDGSYSTQECFHCGTLNRINLGERDFVCSGCGRILNRDLNASRIVLKRAIAKVGQGMPELKPAETWPLLVWTTRRASEVKDAGTIGAQKALEVRGNKPTEGCHVENARGDPDR
ncbi:MAG: transposase [Thaumarchaeota archaeon]|nr:transposase [Nitrososphaerota archaeon]